MRVRGGARTSLRPCSTSGSAGWRAGGHACGTAEQRDKKCHARLPWCSRLRMHAGGGLVTAQPQSTGRCRRGAWHPLYPQNACNTVTCQTRLEGLKSSACAGPAVARRPARGR
jgi:hypothetical protein